MRKNIRIHIKVCNTCQKNKEQNLNYGKLPAKEADAISWNRSSVYIIGPCKIRIEGHDDPVILKNLTIIYPETRWFGILKYNGKEAATISNLVEKTCLCRYHLPIIITYNQGNEFLGHRFKNNLIKKIWN